MARKKAVEPEPEPEVQTPQPDPFIAFLQDKIEGMLREEAPFKDRVALIANAIKFLQAKHKIEGQEDGGSIWDSDD